jgi:hypothetical protein
MPISGICNFAQKINRFLNEDTSHTCRVDCINTKACTFCCQISLDDASPFEFQVSSFKVSSFEFWVPSYEAIKELFGNSFAASARKTIFQTVSKLET